MNQRVERARRRVHILLRMLDEYERRPASPARALLVAVVHRGLADASRQLTDAVYLATHVDRPARRSSRIRAKWEVSAGSAA